jgi:hypothetical protein
MRAYEEVSKKLKVQPTAKFSFGIQLVLNKTVRDNQDTFIVLTGLEPNSCSNTQISQICSNVKQNQQYSF